MFVQDNGAIQRHVLLSNDMSFPEERSETSTPKLSDEVMSIPNRHLATSNPTMTTTTTTTTMMRKVPRWMNGMGSTRPLFMLAEKRV